MRIAAFRPLRYNPERISFISRVVAPPYDVISEAQADVLRESDPHNIIRLILGKGREALRPDSDYERAADTLEAWRRDGVLVREERPAVYLCEQTFNVFGERRVRQGLLCVALLEESASGGLLPHEQTRAAPRKDRLRLMEACHASLSPVFGIYPDADGAADALVRGLAREWPLYEFRSEEVAYRVWRTTDMGDVRAIAQALADQPLLIADGHHRHETALAYRQAHRAAGRPAGQTPEDYVFLYCVSASDPGLAILPTHRLVKAPEGLDRGRFVEALRANFVVEPVVAKRPEQVEAFARDLAPNAIGCYAGPGEIYRLTDRGHDPLQAFLPARSCQWRNLPVTLLHYTILEPLLGIPAEGSAVEPRLVFTPETEQVFWSVESGRCDLGFLMPPTPVGTVEAVAQAGERMPPKSTYFYPKIVSGLAIYPLANGRFLPVLPPL